MAGIYRIPWNYASARRLQQRAVFSSAAPIFSAGPVALNLLTSGYDVQATMSKSCTLSILVGSVQPSDAAFDASALTNDKLVFVFSAGNSFENKNLASAHMILVHVSL